MLFHRSCVVIGCVLLALVAAPAAEAQAATKKPRLASLRSVPEKVEAGKRFRARGRVTHLPKHKAVRVTFTLRKSGRAIALRTVKLKRAKHSSSRRFSARIKVPAFVRAGAYGFRACVRKSCRSKRLRVTDNPVPGPGPVPQPPHGPAPLAANHSLRAPLTGESFYFVMADRFFNGDTSNDTGGISGGKTEHGFDPTSKGYFHGGDLAGLRQKLGYIKRLGTTAIWLTPSFKNKAVQDNNGFPSAGYHGYWITDFTQIDPHLGTNNDLKALIRDAHKLGIKVYFDIISNHTADVIRYQEGAAPAYKSKDESPYKTASGTPFDDRDYAGGSTFPALKPTGQPSCASPGPAVSFPYRPCVPDAERDVKVPAWLNDVSLYHNRGDTTFAGENSQYGDFFGLDDLFTENPAVVNGMIDIYKLWIRDFAIDGFRMDTMKHVDDAFWQRFAPEIARYARSRGISDFYMF